jgi:hypothetical protein
MRPVEVQVDAVLILRRIVDEIVGEAEHAGEFVAGLRIEIGVAAAGVDRGVSDAHIRQARGLVSANRVVAGDVGHVVLTPAFQRNWNIGSRSPKPHVVSLKVSDRAKGTLPNGVVTTPDKIPARLISG